MGREPNLLERIRMAGATEEKYQAWFPRDQRIVGGYKATQTPHELALIIQDLRSDRTFPSYLAYGASTGGTERVLAENIGCLSVSFANPQAGFEGELEANVDDMQTQGIKVRLGSIATVNPDLISFSGENAESDFQAAIPFMDKKTAVVVFGCNEKYGCHGSMMLWRKIRRAHEWVSVTTDNGIGYVRIRLDSIPGENERRKDAIQIKETGAVFVEKQPESGAGVRGQNPELQGSAGGDFPYGKKKDGTPKAKPGRRA